MNTNDPNRKQNFESPPQPTGANEPTKSSLKNSQFEEESLKNKSNSTFEKIVRENLSDARDSLSSEPANWTKEQIITYSLLILGLVLLFFYSVIGGLIVGSVAGYYFSDDIVYYLRGLGNILEAENHLRNITLIGVLLGLLILAPGILIGTAIVAVFKQILEGKTIDSKR